MAYCVEHGIPHSFFLGGPFRWTTDDQDKVLAFLDAKSQVCPECGSRDSDWIDPATGMRGDDTLEAYEHICYGCREIARAQEEQREMGGNPHGVTFHLAPIRSPEEWMRALEANPPPPDAPPVDEFGLPLGGPL